MSNDDRAQVAALGAAVDAMREAQWDRMIDKMVEESDRACEQYCEGRADALLAEVRPRLAESDSLVPLLVPTRHARRAELAVVLAELALAVWGAGLSLTADWPTWTPGECVDDHTRWKLTLPFIEWESMPLPWAGDPLEAARLALAHVRGGRGE